MTAQSRCVARDETGSEHVAFRLLEAISHQGRQRYRACQPIGVSDDRKFANLHVTGDDAAQTAELWCSTGRLQHARFVGWWPTLTADRDERRGFLSERSMPDLDQSGEAVLLGNSLLANTGARTLPQE